MAEFMQTRVDDLRTQVEALRVAFKNASENAEFLLKLGKTKMFDPKARPIRLRLKKHNKEIREITQMIDQTIDTSLDYWPEKELNAILKS